MHNIEPYSDYNHASILVAAMADGADVSPVVGGADRFIGYGDTMHGYGPACILDIAGTEYVAEPHVIWLPWTTSANKIMNFRWAMAYLAEQREVFLTVEKSQKKFFEHFVKRKLLRKVGFLKNLPIVDEVHMYQYERAEL